MIDIPIDEIPHNEQIESVYKQFCIVKLYHSIHIVVYNITNLTDDVRNIRSNERTGCGKLDHQVAGASFVGRPSCNPS